MRKLAVALLFGSLTLPLTFAAPADTNPVQTSAKKKKEKKSKAPKKFQASR